MKTIKIYFQKILCFQTNPHKHILVRNQTIINGRRKDIQASLKNEEFSRKIKENYITKK